MHDAPIEKTKKHKTKKNNNKNNKNTNATEPDSDSSSFDPAGATASFVNYAEGIYVGYKFYETAADEGLIDYDKRSFTLLYNSAGWS